ncbi:uracil-DNA glycosylase family protein [Sphingobium sp. AN641]|uniref:uracil-DNA glycosylase family protein n=1 Tax=Sphingobium sp. AN641 TaxID=3133443 RepID=UPI0030BF5856
MRGQLQDNAAAAADAYMAWWTLAGVDCAVGETAIDWLRPAKIQPPVIRMPPPPAPAAPTDLDAFHGWLQSDANQPESRWPGARLIPVGAAGASLMVVTDMPDPSDVQAGALFTGAPGQLLDAMLRAIGLARADIYLASLALARPPGGMMDVADADALAARMRAHIALATPRRLLLLGDRTIRALGPMDGDAHMNGLRPFNHDGGSVSAIATFHPRLLLQQPAAKAECWRALQCLIEEPRL